MLLQLEGKDCGGETEQEANAEYASEANIWLGNQYNRNAQEAGDSEDGVHIAIDLRASQYAKLGHCQSWQHRGEGTIAHEGQTRGQEEQPFIIHCVIDKNYESKRQTNQASIYPLERVIVQHRCPEHLEAPVAES